MRFCAVHKIKLAKTFCVILSIVLVFYGAHLCAQSVPSSPRSLLAIQNRTPDLQQAFLEKGLVWGSALFIRIFKEPAVLEVWVQDNAGQFVLFKRYNICYFSGGLGPKTQQGDGKSPEGFYFVRPQQMNPWSQFHLSFNLGYPNAYDRVHGYSGSALMVHGSCVSIGCYAMTDARMEEIFTLMASALNAGQPFVRVHIFPFAMTEENIATYNQSRWLPFWQNLKEGYDLFEREKKPPDVRVKNSHYVFSMDQ